MILLTELIPLGTAIKTHGLRGALAVELHDDDIDPEALQHVVMQLDGIFVPFRISGLRPRGSHSVLLTLDGVDTAESAGEYTGHDIYALRRELPETTTDDDDNQQEEGLYAEDLEGFTLISAQGGLIGSITAVDTTTINTLLHVHTAEGHDILIPLAEEWIHDIDASARTISMDVPTQLLSPL